MRVLCSALLGAGGGRGREKLIAPKPTAHMVGITSRVGEGSRIRPLCGRDRVWTCTQVSRLVHYVHVAEYPSSEFRISQCPINPDSYGAAGSYRSLARSYHARNV